MSIKIREPCVVIHGGAGDAPPERVPLKMRGVKASARSAYEHLKSGGSAVDAVEIALRTMEADEFLNAGYGSVLNTDGIIEMDASIMDGQSLRAGCVCLVQDILHPCSLARKVMEQENPEAPVFFAAHGAMKFARENGVEILDPPGQLVTPFAKEALAKHLDHQAKQKNVPREQKIIKKFGEVGTVGAVCYDLYGNVCAGTTTGGMTGKIPGRVGDTPIIGSGTYANNKIGGTSSTGTGEVIQRHNLAANIMKRIEWLGRNAQTATQEAVTEMTEIFGDTGGSVTIDKDGEPGIYFTSNIMPWAIFKENVLTYGTLLTDNFQENI